MRWILTCLLLAMVSACATAMREEAWLGPLAEQYVRLSLEIGAHEQGYIDAYYGPPEWKTEAETNPRAVSELQLAAGDLRASIVEIAIRASDPSIVRRARTLARFVESAQYRMQMIEGRRDPFALEAEYLFALQPAISPLSSYDAALARVESLIPGAGPLEARVDAFRARFAIPSDRLHAVMQAAIAECRARTRAHIALPDDERFDFEFVTGKSWGAYNWYQGGNRSLIQVNTSQPIYIDTALATGCHEGYPGHHVQGLYAERMYRENGWIEYSVLPLYSPQGPLNEGGANYGVDLAFPGDERLRFEQSVLFPLAGLDPAAAPAYDALRHALNELAGSRLTIAALYLDGEIDRERAIALTQRYGLTSRARAVRAVRFAEQYRSYVINYVSGEIVVRDFVEAQGEEREVRWRAYESIYGQPTLPEDLQR